MIHFHRYVLRSKSHLNARTTASEFEGALIRINDGYGALHPWPALGDLPLDAQLQALRSGVDTDLTLQTRRCCQIDGDARRSGRCLFENLKIPQSHAIAGSLPDEQMAHFRFIKVKHADQLPELSQIFPGAMFRIDFNESLTVPEFESFLKNAPLDRIDFIEDPLPYNSAIWRRFNDRVPLAIDRKTKSGSGYKFRVIKPARQDYKDEPGVATIVTSYMDHPIGQLYAAWVAATHSPQSSGLLTHLLFEPDAFSERLAINDQSLVAPGGTGLGFDDLLPSLKWEAVMR